MKKHRQRGRERDSYLSFIMLIIINTRAQSFKEIFLFIHCVPLWKNSLPLLCSSYSEYNFNSSRNETNEFVSTDLGIRESSYARRRIREREVSAPDTPARVLSGEAIDGYHLLAQISTFNPLSILRNVVNLPRFFSNGARASLVRSTRIERRGERADRPSADPERSRVEPKIAERRKIDRDTRSLLAVSNQPPFPYRYPMQFYTGHVASDPKELHPLV